MRSRATHSGYLRRNGRNIIIECKKKVFGKLQTFFRIFLDDDEMSNAVEFKAKLDKIMYQKGQDLENKRMIMVKKQLEIGNDSFVH